MIVMAKSVDAGICVVDVVRTTGGLLAHSFHCTRRGGTNEPDDIFHVHAHPASIFVVGVVIPVEVAEGEKSGRKLAYFFPGR